MVTNVFKAPRLHPSPLPPLSHQPLHCGAIPSPRCSCHAAAVQAPPLPCCFHHYRTAPPWAAAAAPASLGLRTSRAILLRHCHCYISAAEPLPATAAPTPWARFYSFLYRCHLVAASATNPATAVQQPPPLGQQLPSAAANMVLPISSFYAASAAAAADAFAVAIKQFVSKACRELLVNPLSPDMGEPPTTAAIATVQPQHVPSSVAVSLPPLPCRHTLGCYNPVELSRR